MKKCLFLSVALALQTIAGPSSSQAAEVDTAITGLGYFVTDVTAGGSTRLDLYKMTTNGVATKVVENLFPESTLNTFSASDYTVNTKTGKIYFMEPYQGGARRIRIYDIENETFDGYTTIDGIPNSGNPVFIDVPTNLDNLVQKTCTTSSASCASTDPETVSLGGSGTSAVATIDSDGLTVGGASLIKKNSDGAVELGGSSSSVKVGTGTNATTIGGDGLAVGGANLIKKNSDGAVELGGSTSSVKIGSGSSATTLDGNGLAVGGANLIKRTGTAIHIGENSLVTDEVDGVQKLYATDANNNAININVTEGSKLLVEGVEVDPTAISDNTSAISSNDTDISSLQSLVKSSGSEVQIGSDSNGVTISSSAVKVGGENLISKRSDGSVHIGKNSLVLKESGGRQQMWATDASGNSIDIDVTNGSRLLINGRDVEKSIDNVGALSAALGSVPAISADSQFTCGFGAGTHSDAYALSGGCASKISERVSVNAALATVINNQTGGTSDNLSARAGFTFRLGKIDDSPKVAAQKAAQLHDEVAKMREENAMLLARLQKLEQLASLQVGYGKGLASR